MLFWNSFATRDAASSAVADRIESALRRQLATQHDVAFVVSGGTTPVQTFEQLAQKELAWHRVQAILSDERWIPAEHEDSNEKMLRQTLIRSRAKKLQLLSLFEAGTRIEERCNTVEETIRGLPLPFACTLLGMGEDGHFASLFPGAINPGQGLDPTSSSLCIAVKTATSEHDRVSLTLSALCMSDEILLMVFGAAKRAVIEQATRPGSGYPVASLIAQQAVPVHVFWAE